MRSTIEVRLLGKIFKVSEMPVPDQKCGSPMSIFSSAGHNTTTCYKTS